MVGGLWDEVGRLQRDHLVDDRLRPDIRLVDIGCGPLRGGVHFVRYLEPGNYYGLELNPAWLDAGYNTELVRLDLQHRLPRHHLLADAQFAVSRFSVRFDVALVHSLF